MHDWFRIQRGDDEDDLQQYKKNVEHKLEKKYNFLYRLPFFLNCCVYIYALFLAVWAHRNRFSHTTFTFYYFLRLTRSQLSRSILILLEILYIQHVTTVHWKRWNKKRKIVWDIKEMYTNIFVHFIETGVE